jgi:putative transposase
MAITVTEIECKLCHSRNVIKYGHYKGVQRWYCKDCNSKFADNGAQSGQRTPTNQVTSALGMYYEGMSLNAIRRVLNQEHNNYPSDSTVFEWVDKHTKTATTKAKEFHPKVGNTWIADETVLKIDGKNTWFWDIIDSDTRFLLRASPEVALRKMLRYYWIGQENGRASLQKLS